MKQQNNTQDSSEEHWKTAQFIRSDGTIETFPNYMVSDRGRVGSLVDTSGNVRKTMKILKPYRYSRLGHLQVKLHVNLKGCHRSVHRLILSSFHPELWSRDKREVDHINRDPTDNRLDNLHWVSKSQNATNRSSVKQIKVTHLSDGHVDYFESGTECSRAFGKNRHWCNILILERNGFHKGLNIMIEKI